MEWVTKPTEIWVPRGLVTRIAYRKLKDEWISETVETVENFEPHALYRTKVSARENQI